VPITGPASQHVEEEGLSASLLRSLLSKKNDSSQWSNVLRSGDPGHAVAVGLRRAAKAI